MAAKSTKNTKICVVGTDATATDLAPTGITGAKPAEVTVASVTGVAVNDVVMVPEGATGMPGLDGKTFVVGSVDTGANTFTLLGSDTTGETYAAGTSPALKHYVESDMVCLCLATLDISRPAPEVIEVGTFCDPSATLPGNAAAGTVDISGYIDITAEDYPEVLKMDADGQPRVFRVVLPNNGVYIFEGALSGLAPTIGISGAAGWSAQVVLASAPVHLF